MTIQSVKMNQTICLRLRTLHKLSTMCFEKKVLPALLNNRNLTKTTTYVNAEKHVFQLN